MDINTKACNQCGTLKRETNHWIVSIVRPGFEGIIFQPAEACADPRDPESVYEDFCGRECAHKRFDRWCNEFQQIDFPTRPTEKENSHED